MYGTLLLNQLARTFAVAVAMLSAVLAGQAAHANQTSAIVGNSATSTLSVVDLSTLTVTATRLGEIGSAPGAVAIAPGTNHRAFAAMTRYNTVEVMSADTLATIATIPVGGEPHTVVVSPTGRVAYVSNNADSSVTAISVADSSFIATIPVQSGPRGMAFNKDGSRLYVANSASASISIIETGTHTGVDTIDVAEAYPQGVVVTPDGQFLLVLGDSTRVAVISLQFRTLLRNITLSGNGIAIYLSPSGATAYVTTDAGTVDTINIASLSAAGALTGIGGASSVGLSDTGARGYATDSTGGRLLVFDPTNLNTDPTILGETTVLTLAAGVTTIAVPPPIVPVNGWWWNAAESGRGYGLEAKDGKLFISTYLYTDAGAPIWYLANGSTTTTGFSATLNQYGNGQTLNGSYRGGVYIGGVSAFALSFTTPTTATLTWAGGTTTIERYDIVAGGAAAGPVNGMPQTGWWWNESESGRGFVIEVQGNKLFFSGYMYDDTGTATWYISTGDMTSTSLYTGLLQRCSGGQSLTGSYRTPGCVADQGNITLQFTSQVAANMTLPNGTVVPLTRFTNF